MQTATQLATITCPHCGTAKQEQMPVDQCVFFYECAGCHQVLRPKAGDCCVFCSYGSSPCLPSQQLGDRAVGLVRPHA